MTIKIKSEGQFQTFYREVARAAAIRRGDIVTPASIQRYDEVAKEIFGVTIHRHNLFVHELEFKNNEDATLFILKYQR